MPDELMGRTLLDDFEAAWKHIDAYERRPSPPTLPPHAERLIGAALALADLLFRADDMGVDDYRERRSHLEEELGRAAADYYATEAT